MTQQPLTDAEISLLLAKESLESPAAAKIGPTSDLRQSVTDAFTAAADMLKDCPITVRGRDEFHSKELVYHPHTGLQVCERNGGGVPWQKTPETVLAACMPLLERLKRMHAELVPKHQTQVLVNISQAVIDTAALDAKPAEPVLEEPKEEPAPKKVAVEAPKEDDVPEVPEVLTLDDALSKAAKTQTTGRAAVGKKPKAPRGGGAKGGRR